MSDLFSGLSGWITDVINSLGYAGVAALILLENLFPPIPSELILPLSGYMVSTGEFAYPVIVAWTTAGSVAGAVILYGLGAWFGEDRLRWLVARWGRLLFLKQDDIQKADRWFDRHGAKAVFLARLFPVVRSLISVPAGLARMPLLPFLVYTAVGSALWNSALIGLGWALGSQWRRVEEYYSTFQYATIAVVLLAIVWFLYRRWASWRRRVLDANQVLRG